MNLVGKKVNHELWGIGTIISMDGPYIDVMFDVGKKTFSQSGLGSIISPLDTDAQEEAARIAEKVQAEQKKAEKEREKDYIQKFINLQKHQTARKSRSVEVASYTSTEDFFDDMILEVNRELAFLKNEGGKHYRLIDGQRVEELRGQCILLPHRQTATGLY